MADNTKQKITIIGLGLIGGSIGLALKAGGIGNQVEIVGHDKTIEAEHLAKKRGAIDRGEHNLPRAVEGAALIIVAVPIPAVAEVFQQIAPHLTAGAVVTDTASTKAQVMRWAEAALPESVSFVGGHPMGGKEISGIEAADAELFRGRAYCICPSVNAAPEAIKQITGLAQLIGAEPLFMEAEEHDQYAAAISHLPLVVSTALFTLMRSSPSWEDLGSMASSGFRDVTRLASGEPEMSLGIWLTNREALIHWLERMIAELGRFREMLKDAQDEALLKTFTEARLQRDQFIAEPPRRRMPADVPKVEKGQVFAQMILGGKMAENLRRMKEMPQALEQQSKQAAASPGDRGRKKTFAEKIEEGVRRDLEKMERGAPPPAEPDRSSDPLK
ncbi:MAG TPA: prephenate dehydrogenase/arogenate dehydrogenase family protein [Dehalococcoidia bacterium]|jgi:prephenate dehydrogenase|nr:prephenate dehydrogenase/arogenate dehydrogenase family protein [Dehalococcoidia bacterium]